MGIIGVGAVTEAFGKRKAAEGNVGTRSRRFVHLAEHHGHLALFQFFMVYQGKVPSAFFHGFVESVSVTDDAGFYHFTEEVVALTGALSNAGEHGKAVVGLCNVVDEFLDENGLTYASAAEKADFTAFEVRFQKVYDLDSGKEDFLGGGKVFELRRVTVNGQGFHAVQLLHSVYGVSGNVHDTAADLPANRHGDGSVGVFYVQSPAEAVRGVHGDGAHGILSNVLLHLQDYAFAIWALHLQGIPYAGQFKFGLPGRNIEMDIYYRAHHLGDFSG